MSLHPAMFPDGTVAYLEVADDSVQFPVRPILAGRFLIGTAAQCDLRLGDDGLAAEHCEIVADRTSARFRVLHDADSVLLNGEPAGDADLYDGDLLELGDFRLLFRFTEQSCRISLNDLTTRFSRDLESAVEDRLPELTAVELVEHLEQELGTVAELEDVATDRLRELLNAAQSEGPGPQLGLFSEKESAQEAQVRAAKDAPAEEIVASASSDRAVSEGLPPAEADSSSSDAAEQRLDLLVRLTLNLDQRQRTVLSRLDRLAAEVASLRENLDGQSPSGPIRGIRRA